MLDQIVLWVDIAAAAADALLLARVLQLRLQRVYLFITLACIVGLFFDLVQLWWGLNSTESMRISLYGHFLYAFLYPMVAWDVFEEMKEQVSKLRRVAISRLISSLFFAAVFGFVMSLFLGGDQSGGESILSTTLAIVLWAGSSAATLAFLWSLRRVLKAQQIVRPNNTFVWMTFYQLALLSELFACFSSVLASNATVRGILDICLLLYGLLITLWCAVRLKRIPSDVSTPANAGVA